MTTRAPKPGTLALHAFTAYMVLSFPVKGLYFLFSSNSTFVLVRYPRAEELSTYIAWSLFAASLFTGLVWFFYRNASRWIGQRITVDVPLMPRHPLFDQCLPVVAVGIIGWFLWQNGPEFVEKVRTNTILYRNMVPKGEDYESGALGVRAFMESFRNGFAVALLAYAVLYRRVIVAFLCTIYWIGPAVISDGSRFTLIGSMVVLPVTWYFARRKGNRDRIAIAALYAFVLLLPFVVAPLQLLRSGRGDLADSDFVKEITRAALYTFDGLDHLVNYLYLLPIDWTGTRALQELWQFLPRAVYAAKPHIYGGLALQEIIYPHTVGNGDRYLLYGHYPMSNVVMALDACGPVGFIIHAAGTGALLAWIDGLAHRRTPVALAYATTYFIYAYHLVRVGFENYLLWSVAEAVIPFAVFGALLYLARASRGRSLSADLRPVPKAHVASVGG